MLQRKLLHRWHDLDFLKDFWNVIYDARDTLQWSRLARVWQLKRQGLSYRQISKQTGLDAGKVGQLVTGYNNRPFLAHVYLNRKVLGRPRDGWKWLLQCTAKPTNPYPVAVQVPNRIEGYQDIQEFLAQFPPVPDENPALKFFGLTSGWVEQNKPQVFFFLLGFVVGDAGKDYPEYETRSRHYAKTAMRTIMSNTKSNIRVLRYVQLALRVVGIDSDRGNSPNQIIRWNSVTSNLLTWMLRVCIGLAHNQRTSYNSVQMNWLLSCPREAIVAFFQGLADSDGHVDKFGRYAEIGSKPNSAFYRDILIQLGINVHAYPKSRPREVRMSLRESLKLSLFNPTIKSYRFEKLISHATKRGILNSPFST